MRAAASVLVAALCAAAVAGQQAASAPIVWQVDSLSAIGGHPVTVLGSPQVVATDAGPAVAFNGRTDGLLVDANPLKGLARFTLEILFAPDADGSEEQRFLHIEEAATENRALVELRQQPGGAFSIDTYLRHGEAQQTLLDRARTHPASAWHVATLTFEEDRMTHYVDGVRELDGRVAFRPLLDGRTSIGVRQNRVSWFKGRIRTIRVTASVLAPREFLTVPPRVVELWPEGVPGRVSGSGQKPDVASGFGRMAEIEAEGRISNVHNSTLTYYPPAPGTANGTAVIICPGGGYARLAMNNEPAGITPLLTRLGVSVFVLKYRLAEYGQPAPLRDALRAVRLLRSEAARFGIRPDRIGMLGASAGGHVAASAATLHDAQDGRTGAALDRVSGRPDFVALLYPVVTMKPPFAHADSRRNLLGERPAPALVDRWSIETRVTRDTPPVFLVHTFEDRSVPIENGMMLARALRDAGVPVETHFYQRGQHGFGVSQGLGPTSQWPDRLQEWMSAHGWLPAPQQPGPILILPGDHPDPSVLKDGDDYYMTHSSFDAYPGLLLWQSRDLVNWQPMKAVLSRNVGSVWAPDLVKHGGRYYIYFPARTATYASNYVIWADDIRGPWSEPVDLKIDRIDPGHAAATDGRRFPS